MGQLVVQTRWKRRPLSWARLLLGWASIAAGLLGLILPIIPGIPLLIFGLVLLSARYQWAHAVMVWIKKKFHRQKPGEPLSR